MLVDITANLTSFCDVILFMNPQKVSSHIPSYHGFCSKKFTCQVSIVAVIRLLNPIVENSFLLFFEIFCVNTTNESYLEPSFRVDYLKFIFTNLNLKL